MLSAVTGQPVILPHSSQGRLQPLWFCEVHVVQGDGWAVQGNMDHLAGSQEQISTLPHHSRSNQVAGRLQKWTPLMKPRVLTCSRPSLPSIWTVARLWLLVSLSLPDV